MLQRLRAIFQKPSGELYAKPSDNTQLNPTKVFHAMMGLPSGNSLAALLIDANSDIGALRYSPISAAERFICESIANMPLFVYDEEKHRATDLPAYQLLHNRPNSFQTPYLWKKVAIQTAIRHGQSFTLIERNGLGEVARLLLLENRYVTVKFEGGVKFYEYKSPQISGVIADTDMIHLLGFTDDGISGIPLYQRCSEVIKLGLAVEQYALRFFTQGHTGNRYVKIPVGTTPEQYEQIAASWRDAHEGAANQWKTPVLPYGAELVDLQPPNDTAQLLELRKFQLLETARVMRVKPHVIQHYETGGTYANIEAQNIDLVQECLQHWITPFEQEITAKLCPDGYTAEFLIDARLRGSTKERYEAYKIGREIGILSRNDILRMENRPTVPDGDDYLTTPPGAAPNAAPTTPPASAEAPPADAPQDQKGEITNG